MAEAKKTTPKPKPETEEVEVEVEPKKKSSKIGFKVTFRNGKQVVIHNKAVYQAYERKSKDPNSYVKSLDGMAS